MNLRFPICVAFFVISTSVCVAEDSMWLKQANLDLQNACSDAERNVRRCVRIHAMLNHDLSRAVNLADEAYEIFESADATDEMAVVLMQKAAAIRWSIGIEESTEAYAKAERLFSDECRSDLRALYSVAKLKCDTGLKDRRALFESIREARLAAGNVSDPMVRSIAMLEFFRFRGNDITAQEMRDIEKLFDAASVPSIYWKCELKKLQSDLGQTEIDSQVVARIEEITEEARKANARDVLCMAHRLRAAVTLRRDGIESALPIVEEYELVARALGSNREIALALAQQAEGYITLGRLAAAEPIVAEAEERAKGFASARLESQILGAKLDLAIEKEDKQLVREVAGRLSTLRQSNRGGNRVASIDVREEMLRLVDENEAVKSERADALERLSQFWTWAVALAIGFVALIWTVLLRHQRNMQKVNQELRSVNDRLRSQMQTSKQNQAIRERLEHRVAQSRRMESLGALAGGIAHDFNNLLVGIICNAQLLQRKELAADSRVRCLNGILSSAEAATDLSRKMLAYAGREPSAKTSVDLVQLLHDLKPIFDAGGQVRTEYKVEIDSAYAMVDRTHVEQILLNLMANARDAVQSACVGASPDSKGIGVVTIRVGTEKIADVSSDKALVGKRSEGDEFVFVEFEDKGVGMNAEEVTRIFDPFFSGRETGRGMGLAVVYGLINRHDGLIRCSSEPGVGTTMRVLLPKSHAKPKIDNDSDAPTLAAQGELVVIDDERSIREVVINSFSTLNWKTHPFENGSDGIAYIEKNTATIDCIVLDVVMPEMNGREIVDRLGELGISIPIVIMSGFSNTNLDEFLRLPNVAMTMDKPFSIATLIENVSRATFLSDRPVARK